MNLTQLFCGIVLVHWGLLAGKQLKFLGPLCQHSLVVLQLEQGLLKGGLLQFGSKPEKHDGVVQPLF